MKNMILTVVISCVPAFVIGQSQNDVIQIALQGASEFIVINSNGQKTGYNPFLDIGGYYSEIPNSSYGHGGVDSENPDHEGITSSDFYIQPAFSDIYTIKLIGISLTKYQFFIGFMRGQDEGGEITEFGLLDKGQVQEYIFSYSTDTTKSTVFEKIVTLVTLKQDLENAFKLSLISSQGIYKSLLQKLNNAGKSYNRGQIKAAINILQAFINETEAQRGKQLTNDAAAILAEDAELLIQKWEKE